MTGGAGLAAGAGAGLEGLGLSVVGFAGVEDGFVKGVPEVADGRDNSAGRDAEVPL